MSNGKKMSRRLNDASGARKAAGRPSFAAESLEPRTLLSVVITTKATFNDTNGVSPESSLISDASGNLYGTTFYGGALNDGTVFEVAAGSQTVTTLADFNGTDGQNPEGSVIFDADGNLYGTTSGGGAGSGTVFEIAAGTHALTTLVSFTGADGANPEGGLIADGSGNLYGTTYNGGANGDGSVYELAAGTHALSTLVSFNLTNGKSPIGSLVADGSGNMYGATVYGSALDHGIVFEVAAGSHALSTLATFNVTNGENPEGSLAIDGSGNLFGTTHQGGANGDGNVFEVASGSRALSTIVDFNGTNGQSPAASLITDGNNNVYGTTSGGGANNDGTLFQITAGSNTFTSLASFNDADGAFPLGGLIRDGDGNLFGTTSSGGANNAGTVFRFGQNIGPAAKLVFAPEPGNALPGQAIAPGITVAVEDASGNVEPTDSSTVTLSLGSGPAGTALGGTLTATAVNGLATFSNVTFSESGAYTLEAADGSLTPATSSTFDVVPVVGYVDTANMNDITGWASDPSNPTASIGIQVVISGGITQTVSGDLARPDLQSVIGSSNHGFIYSTPMLSVGAHTVNIYAELKSGAKVLIGTKTITSQNSLFDEHYYLETYPDVAAAVAAGTIATGYDHYIQYGQFEGRSPSPYWDETLYLHDNPDVASAVKAKTISSGFMHYYLYGQYENRAGLLYFNNTYYLNNNPDVAAAVTAKTITSGFEHFVLYGQYEGRSPMLYFSSAVYDTDNPDILPFVTGEPLSSDFEQFVEFGQYEGRIASNFYNETIYLRDNPDVAAAVRAGTFPDGFQHWLIYGQYEGRTAV